MSLSIPESIAILLPASVIVHPMNKDNEAVCSNNIVITFTFLIMIFLDCKRGKKLFLFLACQNLLFRMILLLFLFVVLITISLKFRKRVRILCSPDPLC